MIAIIKYNAGNIHSVQNALNRLGYKSEVTDDPLQIQSAEKVILPGVGEASSAMRYLRERHLDQVIINLKQDVLGICLGLQLMCKHSEEGNTNCLGIFDTHVKCFPPKDLVPHIGWNNFSEIKSSLLKNVHISDDVYYVHSYYAEVTNDTNSICNYILPFSASLNKENFYATQFHPEKSSLVGEKILKNFLTL